MCTSRSVSLQERADDAAMNIDLLQVRELCIMHTLKEMCYTTLYFEVFMLYTVICVTPANRLYLIYLAAQ
jgi:hypothetical protein